MKSSLSPLAVLSNKLLAKANYAPGTWVALLFSRRYQGEGPAELNVHDLDHVSKDHPLAVHHRGGHTTYYTVRPSDGRASPSPHAIRLRAPIILIRTVNSMVG